MLQSSAFGNKREHVNLDLKEGGVVAYSVKGIRVCVTRTHDVVPFAPHSLRTVPLTWTRQLVRAHLQLPTWKGRAKKKESEFAVHQTGTENGTSSKKKGGEKTKPTVRRRGTLPPATPRFSLRLTSASSTDKLWPWPPLRDLNSPGNSSYPTPPPPPKKKKKKKRRRLVQ